jgi:acetyl-CoA synthetase
MSESPIYPVSEQWKENAWINQDRYQAMYQQSIENPDQFWAEQAAEFLQWESPWQTVCDYDFAKGEATWFGGGTLNVAVNCIDRHLPERANQTALIWEGDEPSDDKKISYLELHEKVSRMGNVLRDRGVKKGDRVCIYMPMIPEAAYAMLACARIGAVHSVVFGGFSPEALKDRILDSNCQVVITADEGLRGGKAIPLKANVDKALQSCPEVHTCLVVERTAGKIDWTENRDVWYQSAIESVTAD